MRRLSILLTLALLIAACSSQNAPQPGTDTAKYYPHTIKVAGETLGAISKWYTGTPAHWQEIQQANPGLRANRLQIGQTVNIPDSLVIRREPFSQEFIAQLTTPILNTKKEEPAEMASLSPERVEEPANGRMPEDVKAPAEEGPDKKLFAAVMFGDASQIKQLVSSGANANYRENERPVLVWAAQNQSVEVINALIESGADVNAVDAIGHTALMRAADTNQIPCAQALIQAKADVSVKAPNGNSALTMAVRNNSAEMVKLLLDSGANPNSVNVDGDSPALLAAQNDGIEIIKLLGAAKADLNLSNAAYTPLSYAISQENAALVSALLQSGADPNTKPSSGASPIFQAVNTPEIIKLLLDAKANPNVLDDYGQTPLMNAIQVDAVKSAEAFIAGGADVNFRDRNGATALTLAQNSMRTEITELLKKNGATE